MRRIDRETITVEKDGVSARMPMSMFAAESLGRGFHLRRSLRDWYYDQAHNAGLGNGHSLMLAVDDKDTRYFVQIPLNASPHGVADGVQIRDSNFKTLNGDRAEAFSEGASFPVICELVEKIGKGLALAHNDEGYVQAPLNGLAARLSEQSQDADVGRRVVSGAAPGADDHLPIDDIIASVVTGIRDPEICPNTTMALNHAFSVLFKGPAPSGELTVEHVDLLCDAFSARLDADGLDTEAAPAMAAIAFFRSVNSPYDTILVREAMGIDLLAESGCERISKLMTVDLERNMRGIQRGETIASNVRSHIGSALDNLVAEAVPDTRFAIASKAPQAGYFFSGMPNPQAPSVFIRNAAKSLMEFGSVPAAEVASVRRLAEGFGSAADPGWERDGREPVMSDLAPIRRAYPVPEQAAPVVRPSATPSPGM